MPFEVVREVPDAEVKASGPRFEVIGEVRPPRPRGPATIAEQLAEKAKARGTETPVLDTVETFADSLQRGVANVYTGAAKGAGNTLFGLGKLVRDYTPIGRVSDLISPGAFD